MSGKIKFITETYDENENLVGESTFEVRQPTADRTIGCEYVAATETVHPPKVPAGA